MQKDKFEKMLSEVADWDYPYVVGADSTVTFKPVGKASFKEDQTVWHHPVIKEMKIKPKHCEDCGEWCEKGRQTEMRIAVQPQKHWRTKCVTCNKWKHPKTGEFCLTGYNVATYWKDYFKKQGKKS